MKIRQKFTAILAAAFVLSGSFPVSAANTDRIPEETVTIPDGCDASDETGIEDDASADIPPDSTDAPDASDETGSEDDASADIPPDSEDTPDVSDETGSEGDASTDIPPDSTDAPDSSGEAGSEDDASTDIPPDSTDAPDSSGEDRTEHTSPSIPPEILESNAIHKETTAADTLLSETSSSMEDKNTASLVLDEAPPFQARLEYRMGYTVIGTFTDFTPDVIQVQTLYSRDGENWQISGNDWNLSVLGTDNEYLLPGLQNQPCLYPHNEPLKNYIAGEIDRFYLKLRITIENGLFYDTQSAVIERGGPQPIPKGTERSAGFSSDIRVTEPAPDSVHRYIGYGRYQLTVPADATAEEISALLPDTLPVEIHFNDSQNRLAIGTVNCPVTWKPLSLPPLSSGESITIRDAAEEIAVPAGTLVSTPLGIFELDEPLPLNNPPITDEIRLVLNISPEDGKPAGMLRAGTAGLEIAFRHKPTGAVSIQAYVLSEGESKWTELTGLSLLEELDQPSTANSGYALVLRSDQEPYRSYLAAADAGETPVPFFIGLKIQGGIYDDRQFILSWPDIYEQLPNLPKIEGAGGNEGNAGADNRDDSTDSGQRPGLPQTPDEETEEQPEPEPNSPQEVPPSEPEPDDQPDHPQAEPDEKHEDPQTEPGPDGNHGDPQTNTDGSGQPQTGPERTPQTTPAAPANQSAPSTESSVSGAPSDQQDDPSITGQRPNLPQMTPDSSDTAAADPEISSILAPLTVQAAADTGASENDPVLSGEQPLMEHAAKSDSRIPLFSIIAVIAAGCISETVRRTTGYSLFHRIALAIRRRLQK